MGDSNLLGAPRLLQCTVVVTSLAFLLHLIGIATPAWTVTGDQQLGLYESTFTYAVAGITSSVFTGFGAMIIQFLYASFWRTSFYARRWSWVLSFVAALFILLGTIAYGIVVAVAWEDSHLGYSYGLTLFSGLLHIVSVVLLEVDRRRRLKTGELTETGELPQTTELPKTEELPQTEEVPQ